MSHSWKASKEGMSIGPKGSINLYYFRSLKNTYIHTFSPLSLQVWINQGDIILVGLRDYQDAKADVILKYNPDEARNLKSYGELPEYAKINESVGGFPGDEDEEDAIIEFGEVSEDDEIDNVSIIC